MLDNYELISVSKEMLTEGFCFAKESDKCIGAYVDGRLLKIYPPRLARRRISEIMTTSRTSKSAKMDNGLTIQVPDYYHQRDITVINPVSGIVLTRAQKLTLH